MSLGINGSGGGATMVTGTYTGDGSSVTLTFPAVPKLLLISALYRSGMGYTSTRVVNARFHGGSYLIIVAVPNYNDYRGIASVAEGEKMLSDSVSIDSSTLVLSDVTYTYTAFF